MGDCRCLAWCAWSTKAPCFEAGAGRRSIRTTARDSAGARAFGPCRIRPRAGVLKLGFELMGDLSKLHRSWWVGSEWCCVVSAPLDLMY